MKFATALTAAVLAATGCLGLAACDGDPAAQLEQAQPATGDKLAQYSAGITDIVSLGGNADLVQRFCQNAFAAPCPADVATKLGEFGYTSGSSGVDLANAFIVWIADEKDGNADLASKDDDYVWAAYKVALGREPEGGGSAGNLDFIKGGGDRKSMLRSLLESNEFKRLK